MVDAPGGRLIPITRPALDEREWEALREPLLSGWVVQGPRVAEFERRFGAFTGSKYNVASTSCTTALHLAVAALGLKPGDEVLVPGFTWISTANVVEYMGAKPVFVDVERETFNVDASRLEAAVTDRTVGILPVHLFGLCADMAGVQAVADAHDLWVVEDAACGFGAYIDGRHAGTMGHVGAFSFHPRKSITTGEGGMATTQNEELARRMQVLRDHGADRTDLERHTASDGQLLPDYSVLGYNYRMTDLQAAVGCVQMEKAEGILAERRRQAALYGDLLADVSGLHTPQVPEGFVHGYQAYVCRVDGPDDSDDVDGARARRDDLMRHLQAEGIATRQGTHAAALQTYYTRKYGYTSTDFPEAHRAEHTSLALPLFPGLSDDDQRRIGRLIADHLA